MILMDNVEGQGNNVHLQWIEEQNLAAFFVKSLMQNFPKNFINYLLRSIIILNNSFSKHFILE